MRETQGRTAGFETEYPRDAFVAAVYELWSLVWRRLEVAGHYLLISLFWGTLAYLAIRATL